MVLVETSIELRGSCYRGYGNLEEILLCIDLYHREPEKRLPVRRS